MKIYNVSNYKAEIIKPNVNLTKYAQLNNPFALINASLYNGVSTTIPPTKPIGTIIENGQLVNNAGTGFGVGILKSQEYLSFGDPWQSWNNYLTGYNSPVQNGIYVKPNFNDSYVFDSKLPRIGIGQTKDGKTVIIVDDNVTLQQFANNAINQGIITLVNLDGGGSRFLRYNYKNIYTSSRIPYNAIAFYESNTQISLLECPYDEPKRNLYYGCKGEDVKWLQWYLIQHNYNLSKIDGIFGNNTWKATTEFQKTFTKWPDGICGPNTRRELKKL